MRAFETWAITSMIFCLATVVMAEDLSRISALPAQEQAKTLELATTWDNWDIDQFEKVEWVPFSAEDLMARTQMFEEYMGARQIINPRVYNPAADDGGGKIGNGGKILICNDRTYVSDYIWGIDAYGFRPTTFEGENEFEKAANIILRLKEKDPYRYKKYMIDLLKFKSESVFLSNYKMGMTNDISVPGIPSNCIRCLVVNQIVPSKIGEYRYRINAELAKMMDLDTRAGIIVHEIIYKEAIQLGHLDDSSVIYFNSYLASEQFDNDSKSEYQLKLLHAGFSYYQSGVKLDMGSIEIDQTNNIIKGLVTEDTCLQRNGNQFCLIEGSEVTFHDNGELETTWVKNDSKSIYRTPNRESFFVLGSKNYLGSIAIFYPCGTPHILEIKKGSVYLEGNYYPIDENSSATFYQSGDLKSFFLKNSIVIHNLVMDGNISNRSEVTLYPSGKLKSFEIDSPSFINSKLYFRGFFELDENGNLLTHKK